MTVQMQITLSSFYEKASASVQEADQALQEAEKSFQQKAQYMNGTNSKNEVKQFFEMINTFASDLEKAHTDNAAADAKVRRVISLSSGLSHLLDICTTPHVLCFIVLE